MEAIFIADYLKIGQIVNTQGLRGEMRVYPLTDYKERFEEIDSLFLGENFSEKVKIEKVRYKKNMVILKLRGIDHINDVEKLKNVYLYVDKEDRELDEDTYYIEDIIGMKVYTMEDEYVGDVDDVIQTAGANDIYSVRNSEKKQVLIPVVDEFVKEIDMEKGIIRIDPIEGMI